MRIGTQKLAIVHSTSATCHAGVPAIIVNGEPVPPALLSDSAYARSPRLLKSFADAQMTRVSQVRFTVKHCRGRQRVESAFGELKARFRLLQGIYEGRDLGILVIVFYAAAILHNMMIDERRPVTAEQRQQWAAAWAERYGSLPTQPNYVQVSSDTQAHDRIAEALASYVHAQDGDRPLTRSMWARIDALGGRVVDADGYRHRGDDADEGEEELDIESEDDEDDEARHNWGVDIPEHMLDNDDEVDGGAADDF